MKELIELTTVWNLITVAILALQFKIITLRGQIVSTQTKAILFGFIILFVGLMVYVMFENYYQIIGTLLIRGGIALITTGFIFYIHKNYFIDKK